MRVIINYRITHLNRTWNRDRNWTRLRHRNRTWLWNGVRNRNTTEEEKEEGSKKCSCNK